jgi:hypothetical protein
MLRLPEVVRKPEQIKASGERDEHRPPDQQADGGQRQRHLPDDLDDRNGARAERWEMQCGEEGRRHPELAGNAAPLAEVLREVIEEGQGIEDDSSDAKIGWTRRREEVTVPRLAHA